MKPPTFDSLTLRAVATELGPLLVGGQLQKIRQPDAFTVLLSVHRFPGTHRLLLCVHPEYFRAHLTTAEFPPAGEPPAFTMALRKYLEGARVTDVQQQGADRVLKLSMSTSFGPLNLLVELMGRHSNIALVASHGNVIESIKHVGTGVSHRVMLPGRPYPPIPPSDKTSMWDAPEAELNRLWHLPRVTEMDKWLVASFGGASPFLAAHIVALPDAKAAFDGVIQSARSGQFSPTLLLNEHGTAVGAWPLPPAHWPEGQCQPVPSISEALDAAYAYRREDAERLRLVRELTGHLERERDTIERRLNDLRRIEQAALEADSWRVAGELLNANAHAIERGSTEVALPNYYEADLRLLHIPLDPTLSARENADAYFSRQRKARAAAQRVPAQRAQLQQRSDTVASRLALLPHADLDALAALRVQWAYTGQPGQTAARAEPEYPPGVRIRRFTSEQGFTILVGDNATGNDYLTTEISDPDDIWLHVRAAASAHGVIRTGRKPDSVPHSTLHHAARLVAARSEVKNSGTIPVDYVLRRYVRKPRGAAPGRVTYTREKTLLVGPDGD